MTWAEREKQAGAPRHLEPRDDGRSEWLFGMEQSARNRHVRPGWTGPAPPISVRLWADRFAKSMRFECFGVRQK